MIGVSTVKMPLFYPPLADTGAAVQPPRIARDTYAASTVGTPAGDGAEECVRPVIEDAPLEELREYGLAKLVDEVPRMVGLLTGSVPAPDTLRVRSCFGRERATYVLNDNMILDARDARLAANYNAIASLLLRQPQVAVGKNGAVWERVHGQDLTSEIFHEILSDTERREVFFHDLVCVALLKNIWADAGGSNLLVQEDGHISLIDFYGVVIGRQSSYDFSYRRFDGERRLDQLQNSLVTYLASMFKFIVLHGLASTADADVVIASFEKALADILKDNSFYSEARALVDELDWEGLNTAHVKKYYEADLSQVNPRRVMKEALLKFAFDFGHFHPSRDFYLQKFREYQV